MSKNFAGTGYSKGHMDGVTANHSRSNGAGGYSGNRGSSQGTSYLDFKKQQQDAKIEANNRIIQHEYEVREAEEKANWEVKFRSLLKQSKEDHGSSTKSRDKLYQECHDDLLKARKEGNKGTLWFKEVAEDLWKAVVTGSRSALYDLWSMYQEGEAVASHAFAPHVIDGAVRQLFSMRRYQNKLTRVDDFDEIIPELSSKLASLVKEAENKITGVQTSEGLVVRISNDLINYQLKDFNKTLKRDDITKVSVSIEKLKAEASQKGCKTLEKKFEKIVKEADDVLNGTLEYTEKQNSDLGEVLLTATSCGSLAAMYRLNKLVDKDLVKFEDYLAKDSFELAYARLYEAHCNPNFVVRTRYKTDKHEQAKVEKEATAIVRRVDSAYKELHGHRVSDDVIKHMREVFEKRVGPELHRSTLKDYENIEDGFGALISKLLLHYPQDDSAHHCLMNNHYVIKEGESWADDMKFSGEDTGCFDACTIL